MPMGSYWASRPVPCRSRSTNKHRRRSAQKGREHEKVDLDRCDRRCRVHVRHGFEVSNPKSAQVEACGYEREPGDLGDCIYGHTFFYTGNTIYLSCSEALPLTFRLFENVLPVP